MCGDEVSLASSSTTLPSLVENSAESMSTIFAFSDEIPRPTRSNAMNEKELKKWIDAHPRSVRKSVEAAVSKVRHVDQEGFERALKKCARQLVEELEGSGEINGFQYSVYGEDKKSNKWAYKIAEQEFPESLRPEKFLGARICGEGDSISVSENIVLFDDATYSGEQLGRIIRHTKAQVKAAQNMHPDKNIPMPKLWICIPFMTNKGEANVRSALEKTGLEFFIADHERIDTVQELFESQPKTLNTLNSMWGFAESELMSGKKDVPLSVVKHLRARAESQGLIYFDHKVGDNLSFPEALAEGVVIDKKKRKSKKTFDVIPKTHPPYKSSLPQIEKPRL
ncbi:MAG: hypothetical protein ACI9S8_002630 [Chlamydiales bacterium]